jgi:site-specific recombinase XerD
MAKRRRTNGEGAVYQTKDGRWRATLDLGWEDGKRQRKYLSGPTKAAVSRAVREALAQVESGVPLTRDGAGPTVEEWLWYWHDNIQARRVREATLSAQEVIIRRHLAPHLGRVRLRELTPEQVESLLVRLEGPKFNSTSVLKVHRCLSRSLVVAMQRGLVNRNVCTLIDAPTPRSQEVEPLTREEARRTAQLEERLAAGSSWWNEPASPKGMSWDLVFRQPDGKPIGHKRDHADWKALLVEADVRDARLHDARHTAASLLLLLKVPARVVMDILGHSSYQLTMNTYSHVAPELNNEAAQLMAGALWDDDGTEPSATVRRRSQ